MLSRSDSRPIATTLISMPFLSHHHHPQRMKKWEDVHVMMLTQITQISIQLFHTLFVSLCTFALEAFIELSHDSARLEQTDEAIDHTLFRRLSSCLICASVFPLPWSDISSFSTPSSCPFLSSFSSSEPTSDPFLSAVSSAAVGGNVVES